MNPTVSATDVEAWMETEQNLVTRALSGDGKAFAALVSPHLGLLYRVAARAAGNPALAEDAVQEALSVVHRRLRRYRPGTSFKAFVAAVAVKRARTLLRAELRRKRREERAPVRQSPPTPADWAAASELARRVARALGELPPKRQRIAWLRLDGGLDYREIADVVGTTEASARVLVHLALKELEEKLADVLKEDSARRGAPNAEPREADHRNEP
jgi:RNA polymerase sigma-70 factor (ECF subfamily)